MCFAIASKAMAGEVMPFSARYIIVLTKILLKVVSVKDQWSGSGP